MPEAEQHTGLIVPDWPAPGNVHALVSTRLNDASALLERGAVQFLQQIHGNEVFHLGSAPAQELPQADALYTRLNEAVCVIQTADCIPVFFCDPAGQEIALAHAGWRGLAGGVLENTLGAFSAEPATILAWLGPAIGPCHFEVGGEVRQAFLDAVPDSRRAAVVTAFSPGAREGKWMADLYALARERLQAAGLRNILGGGFCTYCDSGNLYSYRRDGQTGRLFSLIWKS